MKDIADFFMLLYLLIVGFFKLIIFFFGLFVLPFYIWKHYDDLKRRSADMAFMARKQGLKFEQAFDRKMSRKLRFLRKVRGSRHYAINVMSGTFEGHSVTMFEYHFQRYFNCKVHEYSKWIEHNYVSYFVLDLEKDFPELSVKKEQPGSKIAARIADAIGRGDIDFESHEFSEQFDVRGTSKKFAYDFCNSQMMEYLLSRRIIPIEVERTALAVSSDGGLRRVDIKPNVEHLVRLRELMPDYLFST